MKILFLCSTNICRSPYAEYHFRRMIEEDVLLSKKVEWVRSAAVLNRATKINEKTRKILLSQNFSAEEVDAHKPMLISVCKNIVREADVLIGMTGWHKWFLPKDQKHKFLTLSQAAVGHYVAIPDPWLYQEERYNRCMQAIGAYFLPLAERIKRGDNLFQPISKK